MLANLTKPGADRVNFFCASRQGRFYDLRNSRKGYVHPKVE